MRICTPLFLTLLLATPALAQPTGATLVTSGLARPLGVTTDAQGRIWVAETGDFITIDYGQISVVLPDGQAFPFLIELPVGQDAEGNQRSVSHLLLDGDDLWFTSSVSGTSSALQRISTAGWTPGDPPRTPADIALTVDVGTFVFAEVQGVSNTNPFALAFGPDGALYLTDAGANVLLRYDPATGALAVHAVFPPVAGDAVPTGLVAADGRLYVATLSAFPFTEGAARVYAVELDGQFAVHRDGLTALNGLALDPRGDALTVIQHGVFAFNPPPPGWQPGTGRAIRLADDRELATGFTETTGATYDGAGALYIATLGGELYRVDSDPVAGEPAPEAARFALHGAHPNPSTGTTTLAYALGAAARVRLAVYDVLGREVALVVDGARAAGAHEAALDAGRLAPGVYVARLTAGALVATRRLTVAR